MESIIKKEIQKHGIKAEVFLTPKTLSINVSSKSDAQKLEVAFIKSGMSSLGICDMLEIGMGEGFELTLCL